MEYNKQVAVRTIMEYWGYDDLSMFSDQQIYRMYYHTLKYKQKGHQPKMLETHIKKQTHDELSIEVQDWINTKSFNRDMGENPMPMCEKTYKKSLGFTIFSFIDKDFNPVRTYFKLYINGNKIYTTNPYSPQLKALAKEFKFEIDERIWDGN